MNLKPLPKYNQILNTIFWPLSIMAVIHKAFFAMNGVATDDFTTVYKAVTNFKNGTDVYLDNLLDYSPHYLYPPSGTLLLSPLAFITNSEVSRWVFIFINLIAILVALVFLIKLLVFPLQHFALPLLIFASFQTETITNSLAFANINGIVFLCEVLFFYGIYKNKNVLSGICLGITFALKPVLLPLLLIVLILKRWNIVALSLGIPLVLNIIAKPLSKDPIRYVKETIPYLMTPRPFSNSSLSGISLHYGLAKPLELALKAALIIMTLVSLYLLYKYFFQANFLNWLLSTGGILLGAEFLLSSLGQGYYTLLLIPLFVTIIFPGSIMNNWGAWIGIYLCSTTDFWGSSLWPALGRNLDFIRFTIGWYLIIYVPFIILISKFYLHRKTTKIKQNVNYA